MAHPTNYVMLENWFPSGWSWSPPEPRTIAALQLGNCERTVLLPENDKSSLPGQHSDGVSRIRQPNA